MPNEYIKTRLLKDICNLNTDGVITLLQENELSECCDAIAKREINGDGLLQLSEANLSLWKNDLNESLQGSLYEFIEKLNNNPEQYYREEIESRSPSPEYSSDIETDSEQWDTDFDEDEPSKLTDEDSLNNEDMYGNWNLGFQFKHKPTTPENKALHSEEEIEDSDNIYANETEMNKPAKSPVDATPINESDIAATFQKELHKHFERKKQVTTTPKPSLKEKTPEVMELVRKKESFLHSQILLKQKTDRDNNVQRVNRNMKQMNNAVPSFKLPNRSPLPPKPKNLSLNPPMLHKKPPCLLKPNTKPSSIKNLDLVADLPIVKSDDSEESNYELVEEKTIHVGQQYRSTESIQTNANSIYNSSGRSMKGSNESVHRPPSHHSDEDDRPVYETIPSEYEQPIGNGLFKILPRPPPVPFNTSSLPTARRQASLSECLTNAALTQARENLAKRPPKSATFPAHVSREPASRPLPPTPNGQKHKKTVESPKRNSDVLSYTEQPWFHNIGRDEAIALIAGGNSQGSKKGRPEGYFLLRPSTASTNQPATLVVWYKNETWNVPVRRRPDSRFALGKVRPNEDSFASIEDLVIFHQKNSIILKSRNQDTAVGGTILTETPSKSKY